MTFANSSWLMPRPSRNCFKADHLGLELCLVGLKARAAFWTPILRKIGKRAMSAHFINPSSFNSSHSR
jgi:hypothetical protein